MFLRLIVLTIASVLLMFGADATGTWVGDQIGPDGNSYRITFKLKVDGDKLTGTMGGDQFEQAIDHAVVKGDDISFTVHLDFNDGIDLTYAGKVGADKIDFVVQLKGTETPGSFVAKKVG